MKNISIFIFVLSFLVGTSPVLASAERMLEAFELIESYTGFGDQVNQATAIAYELRESHPQSGYYELLTAELKCLDLDDYGSPREMQPEIIALAEEALALNPQLARAYVVLARIEVKSSRNKQAQVYVDKALALQAKLPSAILQQAEMARRVHQKRKAERFYLEYIELSPNPIRQSFAYYWMGGHVQSWIH